MFILEILFILISFYYHASALKKPKFNLTRDGRIVGGFRANIANYSYLISIEKGRFHFCGGSLVAVSWVLTAEHCFVDRKRNIAYSLQDIRLVAGMTDFSERYSMRNPCLQVRFVEKITCARSYPDFATADLNRDVCLARADFPFRLCQMVSLVNLTPVPFDPESLNSYIKKNIDLLSCTASGWGSILPYERKMITYLPDHLRHIWTQLVKTDKCSRLYNYAIQKDLICAFYKNRDTCQGDSGGPLVCDIEGHGPCQVGVVAKGRGCGWRFPGMYSRIDFYAPFIKYVVEKGIKDQMVNQKLMCLVLIFNCILVYKYIKVIH